MDEMTDVTSLLNDFVRAWSKSGRPTLYRSLERWPLRYAIVPLYIPGVPLVTFECSVRNNNVVATSAIVNEHFHRMLGTDDAEHFREELLTLMEEHRLFGPVAYRQVNIARPVQTGHGYPQFGYKPRGTSDLVWLGNDPTDIPEDVLVCRRENESLSMKAELGVSVAEDEFTVHFPSQHVEYLHQ